VCPVTKAMAARQRVLLHVASSDDVINLLPGNATRKQPPTGLCSCPNITWAARVGDMTFGERGKGPLAALKVHGNAAGSLDSCLFPLMPSRVESRCHWNPRGGGLAKHCMLQLWDGWWGRVLPCFCTAPCLSARFATVTCTSRHVRCELILL
jgi:hypothetical protein